jgi:non-heme chloroperoxidase
VPRRSPCDPPGLLTVEQIPGAALEVYEAATQGISTTHRDRFDADLLAFLESQGA